MSKLAEALQARRIKRERLRDFLHILYIVLLFAGIITCAVYAEIASTALQEIVNILGKAR